MWPKILVCSLVQILIKQLFMISYLLPDADTSSMCLLSSDEVHGITLPCDVNLIKLTVLELTGPAEFPHSFLI